MNIDFNLQWTCKNGVTWFQKCLRMCRSGHMGLLKNVHLRCCTANRTIQRISIYTSRFGFSVPSAWAFLNSPETWGFSTITAFLFARVFLRSYKLNISVANHFYLGIWNIARVSSIFFLRLFSIIINLQKVRLIYYIFLCWHSLMKRLRF